MCVYFVLLFVCGRAMDTAESRLKECKQIAGRLKGELEQKAQHSRTVDQGPAAMDTSTPAAPPQVGLKNG